MKPTHQIVANRKRIAEHSQAKISRRGQRKGGEPVQQSAGGASRVGQAELDDLITKLDKKFEELAALLPQVINCTPDAFEADQDGIRTSGRKTRKETDEILRGLRTFLKLQKGLNKRNRAIPSCSRERGIEPPND